LSLVVQAEGDHSPDNV